MMVELVRWSLSKLPLFVLTAISAHLVVSSSQTLLHYGLGHHRLGGVFFRNHIRFHHTYYARGHLVSPDYRATKETTRPTFLSLPVSLRRDVLCSPTRSFPCQWPLRARHRFMRTSILTRHITSKDRQLARFAWFRRKQQLHFVHHLHADSNFAVIDFFWDRLLGTYRRPGGDAD